MFADDALGAIPGTLTLSSINLSGAAVTPTPALVVNFRSFLVDSAACPTRLTCAAEVADTPLQQGQGMHGSFSRADTFNFMAALGPSFKHGYVDPMPASNADVGQTIARLLELPNAAADHGHLIGRSLNEALVGGTAAPVVRRSSLSTAADNGLRTVLLTQQVGQTLYFSAAGFPGRTVGVDASGHAEWLNDAPALRH